MFLTFHKLKSKSFPYHITLLPVAKNMKTPQFYFSRGDFCMQGERKRYRKGEVNSFLKKLFQEYNYACKLFFSKMKMYYT